MQPVTLLRQRAPRCNRRPPTASAPVRRLKASGLVPRLMPGIWPLSLYGILACASPSAGQKAKSAEAQDKTEPTTNEEYFDITEDNTREHAAPDSCDDGSCVPCGDAVCLPGLFCEENKSACGWLPQCAEHFNCECLEKELAGCSCEERSGGVFVNCG
jgi:hypothetical protein